LWYNEFAVIWFGAAVLFLHHRATRETELSYEDCAVLGGLGALALLSKQDVGGFALAGLPLFVFAFSRSRKAAKAGLTLSLILTLTLLVLACFILAGGRPFYWMHLGQEGFGDRLALLFDRALSFEFWLPLMKSDFLVFNILWAGWILYFIHFKNTPNARRSVSLFLLLFLAAITVEETSSHGSAYYMGALCVPALLLFLTVLKDEKGLPPALKALPIVCVAAGLTLILFQTKANVYDRWEFKRNDAPLAGFLTSERTARLYSNYHKETSRLAECLNRPLDAFVSNNTHFTSRHVRSGVYGGPLILGVLSVARQWDTDTLLKNITEEPPDFFIVIPELTWFWWGKAQKFLYSFLEKEYEIFEKGNIDIVGTGGGAPSRAVWVLKRRGLRCPRTGESS